MNNCSPFHKEASLGSHTHVHTCTLSDTQPESICLSHHLTVNREYSVCLSGLDWNGFLKPNDETKHMLLI